MCSITAGSLVGMAGATIDRPGSPPVVDVDVDSRRYVAAGDVFAEAAGVLNAVHGQLLDLVILTLADGHHVGPGLHTPGQYVAWKTGMAKATANRLVRIAKRVDELPCLAAALRANLRRRKAAARKSADSPAPDADPGSDEDR